MFKNNTELPTLKEIETDLFRTLQQTYSNVFRQLDQYAQFEGAKQYLSNCDNIRIMLN